MRCFDCRFFSSQTWREFATTDFGSKKLFFPFQVRSDLLCQLTIVYYVSLQSEHPPLTAMSYFTLFNKYNLSVLNKQKDFADHREVFASLRLDRSICRPIVTCIMNNSERWITRLVRRWRAQPTAWISVNCRISWTSTSWTHIAASGTPRGHAWPRVGLANYRCIFFNTAYLGDRYFACNNSLIIIVAGIKGISLKSLR